MRIETKNLKILIRLDLSSQKSCSWKTWSLLQCCKEPVEMKIVLSKSILFTPDIPVDSLFLLACVLTKNCLPSFIRV